MNFLFGHLDGITVHTAHSNRNFRFRPRQPGYSIGDWLFLAMLEPMSFHVIENI